MLKSLRSSSCLQQANFTSGLPSRSHLGRVLRLLQRRFLCSDSSDGLGSECVPAVESKSAAAMLPTLMKQPHEIVKVLALPLAHRPLFPGFCIPTYIKDAKLLASLVNNGEQQAPYVGGFLVKDDTRSEPTGSHTEKSIYELKGKDLLNRLHEVGTLAQITSIQGDRVVLIGHKRLRITEMVSEDPLTVQVDHLKNSAYDKDDDVCKATSFEVLTTIRDVMKTCSLWRGRVKTYLQFIGDSNYPKLADFAAAISYSNKLQCQQVLEELDVHKRLLLSLELLKKEMEIHKTQECIAKSIKEKVIKERHQYLLNEQFKTIKKELGLEIDEKTALIDKYRVRIDANKEKISPHILYAIEEELKKLQLLEANSWEFNVTRRYLDSFQCLTPPGLVNSK
ncbi:lon protease homolog, mitochondrial-like [Rutidosis leptorrhynchoides]|uniref:lon protease homolog, mitochondrial-like n=1 Tax=Rutidosis leptorrhynchoides TaxID=125765 RepID=UPI003A994EC0